MCVKIVHLIFYKKKNYLLFILTVPTSFYIFATIPHFKPVFQILK